MFGMVVFGSYLIIKGAVQMGIVSLVFGIIGTRGVITTIRNFIKQPTSKSVWIEGHISGMVGGYIASVTAFLVVNNDKYIGLPYIVYWTRKYKR
jgi:hypothetical protein